MPILHRCKIHNVIWSVQPCHILEGHGCPRCNESRGEKQIAEWLDNHGVQYVPQKTFDDCKNKKLLPFDFYIPDKNICIEYDGKQHFEPIDFFGGEDGFEQCKYRDEVKNAYCKDNNINLLRIPYNKDIKEELDRFFIHLI